MIKTPSFWYPQSRKNLPHPMAMLLWPLSLVWRVVSWLKRILAKPYQPRITTLCIGNLTAGGTGKTPLVAALVERLTTSGQHPYILTRGHGGSSIGPHLVKPQDDAALIGDEAKFLSQFAPVVVARDRGKGAAWIDDNAQECKIIIMDDGLQNTTITPQIKLAVFNGRLGQGNGMIIPSGPMREAFGQGIKRLDGVCITGDDETDLTKTLKQHGFKNPIMNIGRGLDPKTIKSLKKPVIAFAGLGDPQGFFDMLTEAGVNVIEGIAFPDHHVFTKQQLADLKAKAKTACLVTTEKDMVRITPEERDGIISIPLQTVLPPQLMDIIPENR